MTMPIPSLTVDPGDWRWLPPEVYVPTAGAVCEQRELDDGQRALSVYTSLFTLTAARGAAQEWTAVASCRLPEFSAAAGCTRALINPRPDVVIPVQQAHPAAPIQPRRVRPVRLGRCTYRTKPI